MNRSGMPTRRVLQLNVETIIKQLQQAGQLPKDQFQFIVESSISVLSMIIHYMLHRVRAQYPQNHFPHHRCRRHPWVFDSPILVNFLISLAFFEDTDFLPKPSTFSQVITSIGESLVLRLLLSFFGLNLNTPKAYICCVAITNAESSRTPTISKINVILFQFRQI